ncbi:hypothetical protein GGR54DRAFT_653332 [Hypoxylon sp. NC1633]|nr:hypothetical protein GGR54DRAFT_653332 [Hypoxylon sp. NC1633]
MMSAAAVVAAPPAAPVPDMDPQSIKSSGPGNCGETVEFYPPSTTDSSTVADPLISNKISAAAAAVASPGLRSVKSSKSVESLPAIGAFPLGSLRITEPREEEEEIEEDPDPGTPLTAPDATAMDSPSSDPAHAPFPTGGDILILDDLPAHFTVGCDTLSFTTKKPFPGFRDIPPGAHLIWVAPSEETSSRSAYWLCTPHRRARDPADVHVKQWDSFNEVLGDPASHAEERFQKERLHQIHSSLAPYHLRAAAAAATSGRARDRDAERLPAFLSTETIWAELTSAIDARLLDRITGKPQPQQQQQKQKQKQRSWQVMTTDRVAGDATLAEEAALYATSTRNPPLCFTFPMNAPLISATASGAARTRQALDPSSYVLETLSSSSSSSGPDPDSDSDPNLGEDILVGELAFAFLTGALLGNAACLEQWFFYATRVVFGCYNVATTTRPDLARRLIRLFHAQLVFDTRFLSSQSSSSSDFAASSASFESSGSSVLDLMPSHAARLRRALVTYKARLDEALLAPLTPPSPSPSPSKSNSNDDDASALEKEQQQQQQAAVGAAFADLEAWLWRRGWDLRGSASYVRAGGLMLEDGEVVQAEMEDFADEDERGEFAPVVVRLDEGGREAGLVSWDG